MGAAQENRAKKAANMSVAERRAAAKEKGVSMSDFKAGNWNAAKNAAQSHKNKGGGGGGGNQNVGSLFGSSGSGNKGGQGPMPQGSGGGGGGGGGSTGGGGGGGSTGTQNGNQWTQQYGEGIQGYANWYNDVGMQQKQDAEDAWRAANPNSELTKSEWNQMKITDKGLLSYDSRNPINGYFDADMMKKFGIKGGDVIFDTDAYNSINNYQGATIDGRLNAHYYEKGLVMPLRTDEMGGQMTDHQRQMDRNKLYSEVSGDMLSDASAHIRDKYYQGYHGRDDAGEKWVGSDHYGSVNQASGDNVREKVDNYIADGGYHGDALKFLEGHKENLTSESDIRWYNTIVADADNYHKGADRTYNNDWDPFDSYEGNMERGFKGANTEDMFGNPFATDSSYNQAAANVSSASNNFSTQSAQSWQNDWQNSHTNALQRVQNFMPQRNITKYNTWS